MTSYVLDQPETLRTQLLAKLRDADHAELKAVATALSISEGAHPPVYDEEGIRIPESLIVRSEEQLARELSERRAHGQYVDAEEVFATLRARYSSDV